jgi:hypothetical protein
MSDAVIWAVLASVRPDPDPFQGAQRALRQLDRRGDGVSRNVLRTFAMSIAAAGLYYRICSARHAGGVKW